MNFAATIPFANIEKANADLEAAGFGPNNFTWPESYTGEKPEFARLHSWNNPEFKVAVEALPDVEVKPGRSEDEARKTTSDLTVVFKPVAERPKVRKVRSGR